LSVASLVVSIADSLLIAVGVRRFRGFGAANDDIVKRERYHFIDQQKIQINKKLTIA
jgi:hypothetical protein